jgi:hypothetical protein
MTTANVKNMHEEEVIQTIIANGCTSIKVIKPRFPSNGTAGVRQSSFSSRCGALYETPTALVICAASDERSIAQIANNK